jgi:hypothetical protein
MNQCLIEGCTNEAKLIAKSAGRSYYACKEHKRDVAQIVAAEHTKGELARVESSEATLHSKEEKNKPPKWIGF